MMQFQGYVSIYASPEFHKRSYPVKCKITQRKLFLLVEYGTIVVPGTGTEYLLKNELKFAGGIELNCEKFPLPMMATVNIWSI